MISSHETFGGTWPFAPHFFDGNGFRMHYVEEGSGQPIICLHGEPTWGYLYRRFIPPLSQSHRVIDALNLHDITFVIQDWGGPIAAAF